MTKTRKIVTVLLLALSVAATIAFGFALKSGAADDSFALKAEYDVGEKITVASKTFTDNGNSVTATPIIVYPSGAAVKGNSATLTEAGLYTAEYSATVNGKKFFESENFYAYNNLYSFSGEKSSAFYGRDVSQYETGKTALNVSLAQGEKLTFNKIIDLNDAQNGFVEFFVTPKTRGTPDVQGIYFTLTDIYDPDNTVKFQFKNVAYLGSSYVYLASYVTAGFGNELPRAYTYDSSDRVWRLRINDKFGTGTPLSLYGWAEDFGGTAIKDAYCNFSLDLETKKAYLSDNSKSDTEIIDFDNPDYFDTLWEGFTTGEVILSVEAYDYTAQYFNINFTSVAGYDFSGGSRLNDDAAPEITVFSQGYDENDLPCGYAGKTYPVFDAYAFDKSDGEVKTDTRVYYGYDSDVETELNFADGVVNTARSGKYKIVYTAKDAFRNTATKTLVFFVKDEPDQITVDLFGDYSTSCKAGEKVRLAEASASGGSGELDISAFIDAESISDYEENTVRFLETGAITVVFTAVDMTGNYGEASYTVNVADNPVPVVLDNVVLPDHLFGGLKYNFPQVYAHDFGSGEDVATEVYANGVKCVGGAYTPEDAQNPIDGTDTLADPYDILVEYRAGSDVVFSKTVTVLDVRTVSGPSKNLKAEGYWTSEDLVRSANRDGVVFSYAHAAKDTVSARFAKAVLFENFGLSVAFADGTVFGKFTVRLTDCENPNNYVDLTLKKEDGKTALYVSGEKTPFTLSKGGFYSQESFNLRIVDGKLQDGDSINLYIDGYMSADKAYISVAAEEITAGADLAFTVTSVCGINMHSGTRRDQIEPTAILKGEYPAFADKDSVLDIYPIIAEDIMDTEVRATVTVTLKKFMGETVTLLSGANAFVGNSVAITDYGTVSVDYSVVDGSGNELPPHYEISVVNFTDPVINFSGKVPATVKLGETVRFDAATATDNAGNLITVKYLVVKPSVMPVLLGENREYTPSATGNYIFRIFAEDVFGNIAIKDYGFKVVD